ncbi:EcoAI/FtnUII family type I restriction enzme subunit R [Nonomuraea wenchangensis]|uniref:EcoAI/FtnUII family type I restriction enzme subunit R n=1 Tax=Nonomuraea wenchangensis TaxID=568860 RepID=UPI00378CF4DA
MNKRDLSEADICAKYITPAILASGWNEQTQIQREVHFTKGQVHVRGKMVTRGKSKFADYVLYYKPNIPIAIVEAKDNRHSIGDGIQQALDYAEILQVPFAFSSNGDGFLFHDKTGYSSAVEVTLDMNDFPSPDQLWALYRKWKGLSSETEKLVLQDYFDDGSGRQPRYYQRNAINATVEAIAKGQDRLLLVMATGTGKTYTAFQAIWRLWKAGRMRRVLYLADRNVLIDQTMVNDFRPFNGAMAKLSTASKTIEAASSGGGRRVDSSYEIYLSLYQAITGPEERQKLFREFSPGFFDLIVVDECHRGSADEDAAWREILEYFSSAVQIGMTATPKETKYVSNMNYFGQPIYSYSLKQGIQDGFLAPYKVVNVHLDVDVDGYRPPKGKTDRNGELIPDRIYGSSDMDRTLVIDERTRLVAKRITEFLKEGNARFHKTIVFCIDQEHAGRMRQALVNENPDLAANDRRYVMRITGNDRDGQDQLGNFIDPETTFPVLVTTSRLLSTGVDVQTCRLIVLDRPIESMTEFKQILGRGTRIHEDSHKYYFTLMDFRGATRHFADPEFDGDPVQIYEPGDDDPIVPPDPADTIPDEDEIVVDPGEDVPPNPAPNTRKFYVNGVLVTIIAERVKYLDSEGKLVTESLRDYSKRAVTNQYASLDNFLRRWNAAERKQAIIEELEEEGLRLEPLAEEVNPDLDPFDLICHVAYGATPRTRRERADSVRQRNTYGKYGQQARAVLDALLQKYQDNGIVDLGDPRILQISPFDKMGTPLELIRRFGSRAGYLAAIHELQDALYDVA